MIKKFYPPVKSVTLKDQQTVWKVKFSGVNGDLLGSIKKTEASNLKEAREIFLDRYSTKKKCLANSKIEVEPKGVQYELTWTIKNQIMKLMRPIILN